jgi:hypothetical protein
MFLHNRDDLNLHITVLKYNILLMTYYIRNKV